MGIIHQRFQIGFPAGGVVVWWVTGQLTLPASEEEICSALIEDDGVHVTNLLDGVEPWVSVGDGHSEYVYAPLRNSSACSSTRNRPPVISFDCGLVNNNLLLKSLSHIEGGCEVLGCAFLGRVIVLFEVDVGSLNTTEP